MAYVPVPKDLTKIKSKVMFNLTKRQIICFGGGALIGVPLFFLLRGSIGTSPAAILMVVAMLPLFIFGLYERNGQPLEKVLGNIIQTMFVRPKQRPYQTNNLYAALMRQEQMEREVKQIVRKKKKANP
ncbi:MAG: PrgI family protein [Eubacteriales bacterium]|nr:PrgI family protein [Eubacteriales bacterium]